MTSEPALTPRAQAQHAERLAREAQALRRNLLLRKQQQRARAGTDSADTAVAAKPGAAP